MNVIDLKAIRELLGMNFWIPDYQRGYRWTHQQVQDLLEDIKEFMASNKSNIYCIQPLVVKRAPMSANLLDKIKEAESIDKVLELIRINDTWEVIDGQQRLTTIYIILKYLQANIDNPQLYTIAYETRRDSWKYLDEDITKYNPEQEVGNIDFYHMGKAYCFVKKWFEEDNKVDQKQFLQTLLDRVKFIWYAVEKDQNSKEIFQRLNLGKISLTNSELIKAVFLKRNYNQGAIDIPTLQISVEWDLMESALQNDELWGFINSLDYESPTRIDYIFDIIRELQLLGKYDVNTYGNDEYATFRYFYSYIKNGGSVGNAWAKVYEVYEIFNEWYNTSKLYHYIGYIIATTSKKSCVVISNLIKKWQDVKIDKNKFVDDCLVKDYICKSIKDVKNLSLEYDREGGPEKSKCRPLLLLHNIETVVRQNDRQDAASKFGNVFYRFPFNLYKGSRNNIGWDVEHIDSNTENELRNQNDRIEYLKYAYLGTIDKKLKADIKALITSDQTISDKDFREIRERFRVDDNTLDSEDKNRIWNFALLDSKTNRGYGNSPFSAKRRVIIGKEQGVKYIFDKDCDDNTKEDKTVTFIPPCTRNAFLKYYSTTQATNLTAWLKEDAEAYRKDMEKVLAKFLN